MTEKVGTTPAAPVFVADDLRHRRFDLSQVVADDAADSHIGQLVGVVAHRVFEVRWNPSGTVGEGRHQVIVAHDRHVAGMDAEVGGVQLPADVGLDRSRRRPDLTGAGAGLDNHRPESGGAARRGEGVGGRQRRRVG